MSNGADNRCLLLTNHKQTPAHNYTTKLCKQQAEVKQTHENANTHDIGKGEVLHRKYKRLKLGGGHMYDRSSD
jgi:hypothetical protein